MLGIYAVCGEPATQESPVFGFPEAPGAQPPCRTLPHDRRFLPVSAFPQTPPRRRCGRRCGRKVGPSSSSWQIREGRKGGRKISQTGCLRSRRGGGKRCRTRTARTHACTDTAGKTATGASERGRDREGARAPALFDHAAAPGCRGRSLR